MMNMRNNSVHSPSLLINLHEGGKKAGSKSKQNDFFIIFDPELKEHSCW